MNDSMKSQIGILKDTSSNFLEVLRKTLILHFISSVVLATSVKFKRGEWC